MFVTEQVLSSAKMRNLLQHLNKDNAFEKIGGQ